MKNPGDGYLMSALYDLAKNNQRLYYFFTLFGFSISSFISMYSSSTEVDENNPNYLILTICLSAVLIVLGYIFQRQSLVRHSQAEKFRKFFFVKDVIDENNTQIDPYIYYEIGDIVFKRAWKIRKKEESKSEETAEDLSNPYVLSLTSFNEKVIESIQQNCFQTAANLMYYYKWLKRWVLPFVIIIFAAVVVVLIIGMINFKESGFNFSQIFIALISLYFTIDFHRFFQSYSSESKQLQKLEQQIDLIKKGVNQSRMMYYFSEYIAILESKPSTPVLGLQEKFTILKDAMEG
jgi:hypothetical protein